MKFSPAYLCSGALIALLAVAAQARAGPIYWSYTWSSSPGSVAADGGSGSSLQMLPTADSHLSGTQDILAAQLQAIGSNPFDKTATFTNAPYSLTVTIHDEAFNKSGSLTFSGTLGGWFNLGAASITNQFNNPLQQQLTLGKDIYAVTIGSFASPGSPNSGVYGRIGADVTVSGPGGPATAPEPGSLALAALGASALAARRWWQRRRGTPVSEQAQAV